MFFKNLIFFTFPPAIAAQLRYIAYALGDEVRSLSELMLETRLKPLGDLDIRTRGWVSPFGIENPDCMIHSVGNCFLLTLGGEDRILPAAAVNTAWHRRIESTEEKQGRKLGGKARRSLKEDVLHEMIPRAFVKQFRLAAYIDLDRGFIAINTSSRKQAENFVSEFRHTLGSFPAIPVNSEDSPAAIMTDWVRHGKLPKGLNLGDSLWFEDADTNGGKVKITSMELTVDEVLNHIQAGKRCTRLELVNEQNSIFMADEDLVVRKLKLLEGAMQEVMDAEFETPQAALDANFALMAGEVGAIFDQLSKAFKFSKSE